MTNQSLRAEEISDAIMEQDIQEPMVVAKIQMLWVLQGLFLELPEETQRDFAKLTPYQIIDYALNRK